MTSFAQCPPARDICELQLALLLLDVLVLARGDYHDDSDSDSDSAIAQGRCHKVSDPDTSRRRLCSTYFDPDNRD